jgi:hypothetical protein
MQSIMLQDMPADRKREEIHSLMLQDTNFVRSLSSPDQVMSFAPQAPRVFLSLPIRVMTPSGRGRSDIHIEFREMPIKPYPVHVYAVVPFASSIITKVQLPNHLNLTPFSEPAFEFIWSSLVLALLHDPSKYGPSLEPAYRPAVFTMPSDSRGGRAFADYVSRKIGTASGTEFRFIARNSIVPGITNGTMGSETMAELMDRLEKTIVDRISDLMQWDASEWVRSEASHSASEWHEYLDRSEAEVVGEAMSLKDEGNEYYTHQRFTPARRCYAKAIGMLRVIVQPSMAVHQLLGPLLSNRAAVCMKIAESVSDAASALRLYGTAVEDCESVIKSCWHAHLPLPLQHKIAQRLSTAAAAVAAKLQTLEQQPATSHHHHHHHRPVTREETAERHAQELWAQEEQEQSRRQQSSRRNNRRRRNVQLQQPAMMSGLTTSSLVTQQPIAVIQGQAVASQANVCLNGSHSDLCPICLLPWHIELAHTHVIRLNCHHAICVPCWSRLDAQRTRVFDGQTREVSPVLMCPLCRAPCDALEASSLANAVRLASPLLLEAAAQLPLRTDEIAATVNALLVARHFHVDDVKNAVEAMSLGAADAALYMHKGGALSSDDKERIYQEANRPVKLLYAELRQVSAQLARSFDMETPVFRDLATRESALRQQLTQARLNARADIFQQMNRSDDTNHTSSGGDFKLDFHALTVADAIALFESDITPVLPVLKSIILITGRGLHSPQGQSVLRQALCDHIEAQDNIIWDNVRRNSGAIRVRWQPRA